MLAIGRAAQSSFFLVGVLPFALLFGPHTRARAEDGSRDDSSRAPLVWRRLADIPNREGLAAPFAGVGGGALVVAGGANFPGKKPWEGGTKVWHDRAYVLESVDGKWRSAGELPRPLAYGVSITTPRGIACLGGSDHQRHYADCFLLIWNDGRLESSPLPPLPKPCANFTGALAGTTLFVAGGLSAPHATEALRTFWSLDLSSPNPTWQEHEPWPGPARMFATMAVQGGEVYLFGGAALRANVNGKQERQYLADAYGFTPGRGWKPLADLPQPVVAAPTPAIVIDGGDILLFGGDNGEQISTPPETHHGFSRRVLRYHVATDKWSTRGKLPFSFATTSAVEFRSHIVVPGGEVRPGIRSNQVWAMPVPAK